MVPGFMEDAKNEVCVSYQHVNGKNEGARRALLFRKKGKCSWSAGQIYIDRRFVVGELKACFTFNGTKEPNLERQRVLKVIFSLCRISAMIPNVERFRGSAPVLTSPNKFSSTYGWEETWGCEIGGLHSADTIKSRQMPERVSVNL